MSTRKGAEQNLEERVRSEAIFIRRLRIPDKYCYRKVGTCDGHTFINPELNVDDFKEMENILERLTEL